MELFVSESGFCCTEIVFTPVYAFIGSTNVAMKFGRFHGIALLVLGALLLLGQAYISVVARGQSPAGPSPDSAPNSDRHDIPPFFGIVGGLMLVTGAVIFLVSPKKSLKEEVHEDRRP